MPVALAVYMYKYPMLRICIKVVVLHIYKVDLILIC